MEFDQPKPHLAERLGAVFCVYENHADPLEVVETEFRQIFSWMIPWTEESKLHPRIAEFSLDTYIKFF